MYRRIVTIYALALLVFAPLHWGQATESPDLDPDAPRSSGAVLAVTADLEVERVLLQEALQRYESLANRRDRLLARLAELYGALDEAVRAAETTGRARSEALLEQIDAVEGERDRLLLGERTLIESIVTHGRRSALLEQQLAALLGRAEQEAGALSGVWDVVLMPLQQKGSFTLRQYGTLVNGTYRLGGGWSGSLQGTLVNRKVYLVRIDSKLGKSMELEGFLSSDGKTIRGSWLNYELAGGEGSTGQWSATKRAEQRP